MSYRSRSMAEHSEIFASYTSLWREIAAADVCTVKMIVTATEPLRNMTPPRVTSPAPSCPRRPTPAVITRGSQEPLSFDSPPYIAVYRQRPRTTDDKGRKASEIEQVTLVSRRSELGSAGGHAHQLDRAESKGQMDSEDRHEENRSRRQTCEWDESPEQHCETADEFGQNGEPCQEMRRGHAHRMQDGGEGLRSPGHFREAMLHEAIANNQP